MALQLRRCPAESKAGIQAVLDGEYDIGDFDVGPNPIVLDIGANLGAFCLWAVHKWPGASVFAYEPNPETFRLLEENTAEFQQVTAHRCAVWLADGKARLFAQRPGGSAGECSLKDIGEQDVTRGGNVKVIHAASLPEADVLKLDTEGCELEILKAYPHLGTVKAVMLEWHSHADRVALRELLARAGFTMIADTEWHWAGRGIQKWARIPKPTLFLSVLAGGGQVWQEHRKSVDALQGACSAAGINMYLATDMGTGVDRARNRQVAAALALPDVTHFMFIDADIVFDPAWVVNMVKSGLDVVAGAYPRKEIDWGMVGAAARSGVADAELPHRSTSFIFNFVVDNNGGTNAIESSAGRFVEVEEIGTGFFMCRREVLEKVIAAHKDEIAYVTDYPPRDTIQHMVFACRRDPTSEIERAKAALLKAATSFDEYSDGVVKAAIDYATAIKKGPATFGRYLTEDYSFCRLWRMLGGKIYLYLDAAIEHIGVHKYQGQIQHFFTKQAEEQPKVGENDFQGPV